MSVLLRLRRLAPFAALLVAGLLVADAIAVHALLGPSSRRALLVAALVLLPAIAGAPIGGSPRGVRIAAWTLVAGAAATGVWNDVHLDLLRRTPAPARA